MAISIEAHTDVPAGSAILRAIRILEALAEHERPPQLAEIAQAVQLPKPTVLRILGTLEHAGVVAREPDTKRYGFAERLNQFAGQVLLSSPHRAARNGSATSATRSMTAGSRSATIAAVSTPCPGRRLRRRQLPPPRWPSFFH